jgi:hypothetical protein
MPQQIYSRSLPTHICTQVEANKAIDYIDVKVKSCLHHQTVRYSFVGRQQI